MKFKISASIFCLVVSFSNTATAGIFDDIGDVFEGIIHLPGDLFEDLTGIDVDWADDMDHLAKEFSDELCELSGADNCTINAGVMVSPDGDVTLLQGPGAPVAKPISEIKVEDLPDYYRRIKAANLEVEIQMDRALAKDLEGRYPAGTVSIFPDAGLTDIPVQFPQVNIGNVSQGIGLSYQPVSSPLGDGVGAAVHAANIYIGVRSAIQLSRELNDAGALLPAGRTFEFYAVYSGPELRFIYPKGTPVIHSDAKSYTTFGPFVVPGTNVERAEEEGGSCSETPSGTICSFKSGPIFIDYGAGVYGVRHRQPPDRGDLSHCRGRSPCVPRAYP